jgi:hypothetical protein
VQNAIFATDDPFTDHKEAIRLSSPLPGGTIQEHAPPPASEKHRIGKKGKALLTWLLLCLEVACLAGILRYITTVIWSPKYLTLGDVQEYHQYALVFWTQPPLFHQFPQEYPPLALLPFAFTLSSSSSFLYYWAFALWMGVIVCLSYLWLARMISHSKALVYALYLLVGTMATLLMRYDLLPALATLGALLLAERKRYFWAYTLLAVGVLLKLYPAFLVPVVMAAQWREPLPMRDLWQRGKPVLTGVGLFVFLLALGFGVPLLINPQQAASVFQYNLARPIQVESAPGSLLWLGTAFGFPVQGIVSFGSLNLVGPLENPLKLLSLAALVGGSLLVYWRVLSGKLTAGPAFLAVIGVVLVSNKVLSPQYFIWILPLVAYVVGLDLLWIIICLLTTLIYPFLYHVYYHVDNQITNPVFLWAIAIRNALLLVAVARAVLGKPAWPSIDTVVLKRKITGLVRSIRAA